jgi:hypothetical protein
MILKLWNKIQISLGEIASTCDSSLILPLMILFIKNKSGYFFDTFYKKFWLIFNYFKCLISLMFLFIMRNNIKNK